MTAPRRIAAFAASLIVVFAGSFAVGAAVGPDPGVAEQHHAPGNHP